MSFPIILYLNCLNPYRVCSIRSYMRKLLIYSTSVILIRYIAPRSKLFISNYPRDYTIKRRRSSMISFRLKELSMKEMILLTGLFSINLSTICIYFRVNYLFHFNLEVSMIRRYFREGFKISSSLASLI